LKEIFGATRAIARWSTTDDKLIWKRGEYPGNSVDKTREISYGGGGLV